MDYFLWGKVIDSIEISSPLATIIFKLIFPIGLIIFFGFAFERDWNSSARYSSNMLVLVLFGVCFIGVHLVVYAVPLKRVCVSEKQLYVSNLFRTIVIDKKNIEEVKETIFSHPKMIKIKFKEKTPFGYKIKFLPIEGSFWTSSQRIIDLIEQ